jgi:hypothetical protein
MQLRVETLQLLHTCEIVLADAFAAALLCLSIRAHLGAMAQWPARGETELNSARRGPRQGKGSRQQACSALVLGFLEGKQTSHLGATRACLLKLSVFHSLLVATAVAGKV